jgi:hypothetical protein
MNSPSTNVAVMYTSDASNNRDTNQPKESTHFSIAPLLPNTSINRPQLSTGTSAAERPSPSFTLAPPSSQHGFDLAAMPPPSSSQHFRYVSTDPVLVSDADLLLNFHSPFSAQSPSNTPSHPSVSDHSHPGLPYSFPSRNGEPAQHLHPHQHQPANFSPPVFGGSHYPAPEATFGDMVIDSQDIDMSVLGADMMPWDLEYLPHDFIFYGEGGFANEDPGGGGGGGGGGTG